MLQCLTQLIILQTSIRFQLSANSSQPPITAALFFLQITRHFGGSLSSLVIICWSFHCVVFPKCAQRSLAMYRPMSSDARSGRGQFSPQCCPRLTRQVPIQCTKQIPTRHKGQHIFMCAQFFPVYIHAECNIYGTALYMWCQRCHLILKLLK